MFARKRLRTLKHDWSRALNILKSAPPTKTLASEKPSAPSKMDQLSGISRPTPFPVSMRLPSSSTGCIWDAVSSERPSLMSAEIPATSLSAAIHVSKPPVELNGPMT
eukprot:7151426-Prymnesium_polylepis.2